MVEITYRNVARLLVNTVLACLVTAIVTAAAGLSADRFQGPAAQQGSTPATNAQPQNPTDRTERLGPFLIGGQQYTVLFREKALVQAGKPEATLVGLEILNLSGETSYQEVFSYEFADGHFSKILTSSVMPLPGRGGAALVIRFLEEPEAGSGTERSKAKESWQLFGVVNGRLVAFGAVLPLGRGAGITVGGVVTGVMVQGGIAVVPLASTAEEVGFRVWEGNFHVYVPVRLDWMHGQWGEGEQCYELNGGTLLARGCRMRVEAHREVQPEAENTEFVRLFVAPDGNTYNSQVVEVRADSNVDFLAVLAVVHWQALDERVACSFDNVWLETQVDGQRGWVHGEEAFEALGLPQTSPR
jgi:hypothetical protein